MGNRKLPPAQMSESVRIGALLAIIGGFFDAYSYLCRGGVFANAQTGNIVLLGVRLAENKWLEAGKYFLPVFAFALGVFIAEYLKLIFKEYQRKIHWRQVIVLFEVILVAVVAFLPQKHNMIANILISFICALQVETFRKVRGSAFATTMCTGNLRSATEQLAKCFMQKDKEAFYKARRYATIILYFIIGAVCGVFGVEYFAEKAVIACCLVLIVVFVMMFYESTQDL